MDIQTLARRRYPQLSPDMAVYSFNLDRQRARLGALAREVRFNCRSHQRVMNAKRASCLEPGVIVYYMRLTNRAGSDFATMVQILNFRFATQAGRNGIAAELRHCRRKLKTLSAISNRSN